ncbi:MAG: hypothetical protein Q9227_001353 [Pyrenula ochraceoflavens]
MATKATKIGSNGHTAGIYADMTLDGPEIGTLVAVIDRAKNLPNRKSMGKQDPYCAMRLGKEAKKTETDRRGGQTPRWDQELRFTVHECPDYYRLKMSIFNDDKKSELIGEAFVDLKSIIVPGGGQGDLWQQLHCKGKYAGEVRVELTYYDIRPPDASVLSKRGQAEDSPVSNGVKSTSKLKTPGEPKHFGPREIRRRPLPPDPTGKTLQRPSLPEVHSSPIPQTQTFDFNSNVREQWAPDQDFHSFTNPSTPNRPATYDHDSQKSPYDFELPRERIPFGTSPQQYDSAQHPRGGSYDDYSQHPSFPHQDQYSLPVDEESFDTSPDGSPFQSHGYDERRHSAQPSFPPQNRHGSSPQGSSLSGSSPFRPAPSSGDLRKRAQFNRFSTSPIKNELFKDSPLRQSMSQDAFNFPSNDRQQDYENDEPPPPPPAHRSSSFPEAQPVKMPEPLNLASTPDRPFPRFQSPLQSIERACDPLQNQPPAISSKQDRDGAYVAYSKPAYSPDSSRLRRNSQIMPPDVSHIPSGLRTGYQPTVADADAEENAMITGATKPHSFGSPDPYFDHNAQRYQRAPSSREHEVYGSGRAAYHTPDRDVPPIGQPSASSISREQEIYGMSSSLHNERDREVNGHAGSFPMRSRDEEVYGARRSPNEMDYSSRNPQIRRPVSGQDTSTISSPYQKSPQDRADSTEFQQSFRTVAPIYKPRAVSPGDRSRVSVPSRRSVSPNPVPTPSSEEHRLSGIPFSPDSFDVLNPSSVSNSSVADGSDKPRYETPEQAREAARLREVEKMREVGPIIGNDGREIDPSDHLPSDTWAPEPERKPKKPEVVIRFKTGNRSANNTPPQPTTTLPTTLPPPHLVAVTDFKNKMALPPGRFLRKPLPIHSLVLPLFPSNLQRRLRPTTHLLLVNTTISETLSPSTAHHSVKMSTTTHLGATGALAHSLEVEGWGMQQARRTGRDKDRDRLRRGRQRFRSELEWMPDRVRILAEGMADMELVEEGWMR